MSRARRGALDVAAPGDREIVMTRSFAAPRRVVFDAWTRPELLVRWYGARGWNLVECDVDLRIGGTWRFVSQGPDEARLVQFGVYREVVPPDRLVLTETFEDQSYPGETLITHVFAERHGETTVTSTVRYASQEARNIVIKYPMARGVSEAYERLDAVLMRADQEGTSAP